MDAGCGSSAIRQSRPEKLETIPDDWVIFCSPELVELDWPAITNTSPTPNFWTVASATGWPPLVARALRVYQPPAPTGSSAQKARVTGSRGMASQVSDRATPSADSPVMLISNLSASDFTRPLTTTGALAIARRCTT